MDPGRVAQLLFNVNPRMGFGTGFIPPTLLAWNEGKGMVATADILAIATGQTGTFAGGHIGANPVLYYTNTGGQVWRDITARLPVTTGCGITAIGANPGSPYVYIATTAGHVFKSANDGTTFTNVTTSAGFSTHQINAIAFNHPDQMWVGSDGGHLKYTDHTSWTDRTSDLGWGTTANVSFLAQKKQNKAGIMVAGVIPTGPTGMLAYTDNGSTFTDHSSMIASCIEYDALGYSSIDDRFLIAGLDASYSRVFYTTDNGATGNEIAAMADAYGLVWIALHVIMDTWACIRTDGAIFRITQDRAGNVRLADEMTEIAGLQLAYANAKALGYDPTLNRYFVGGDCYCKYTDDLGQVGAFITRALPAGSALIGSVQLAPAKYHYATATIGDVIKSGPGLLVGLFASSLSNTSNDVTLYDNTSAAVPIIVEFRLASSTTVPWSFCPTHPIQFNTGLTLTSGHGNNRVTVVYI
ncbi:MAG: hypothetical protein V2A79_19955 [Planctomycetota bacterium]